MAIVVSPQVASIATGAASTTQVLTVGATGVGVGELAVLAVGYKSVTTQTVAITDSKGNTWAAADEVADKTTGTNAHVSLFTLKASVALVAADTITATFGASVNNRIMHLDKVTGFNTTTWLDKHTKSTGASASPNSTASAATAQSNEIVYGVIGYGGDGSTFTPGSGFTQSGATLSGGNTSADLKVAVEYKTVSSVGAQIADAAIAVSTGWAALVSTYISADQTPVVIAGGGMDAAQVLLVAGIL